MPKTNQFVTPFGCERSREISARWGYRKGENLTRGKARVELGQVHDADFVQRTGDSSLRLTPEGRDTVFVMGGISLTCCLAILHRSQLSFCQFKCFYLSQPAVGGAGRLEMNNL